MENCTNCSENHTKISGPGFGAFLVILSVIVIVALTLNILIITTLCVTHTVAKLLRIFLINLLVAGLSVAIFGIGFCLSGLILNFSSLTPPDLGICRLLVWGYAVGAISRLYCLAGFSLIVLLIVRYNKKELKAVYIVLFLASIWLISILLNIHLLVPPIFAVQYYDGVACFTRTLDADIIKEARYFFTAIWVGFGGVTPLIIGITVPSVVLCYVRRNTSGSSYKKGMAKFTLFLVAGNLINIVGQAVVTLLAYVSEPPGVYLSYLCGYVSLLPTPIMILVFMKPVRYKLSKMLGHKTARPLPHDSRVQSADKTLSTAVESTVRV